ncbi:hypothetical protein OG393_21180 [Streptomyces sp. NBC_01216]|uniref:hypothetical protein n=1 Tax=Streptomyces sp. NBC_01216 TaxID=2903778 RepID=UPI002E0D9304|nr:hypothetical protein OG393_21180 [Streptomyces sp. NBC_01216]
MSIDPRLIDAAAKVLRDAMDRGNREPYSLAFVLDSVCMLQSPETAAEQRRTQLAWRLRAAEAEAEVQEWRVVMSQEMGRRRRAEEERDRLQAERHSTNEALSDAAEALRVQRDRIAVLEARLGREAEQRHLMDALDHPFEHLAPRALPGVAP